MLSAKRLYEVCEPIAGTVKVALQMLTGVVIACVAAYHALPYTHADQSITTILFHDVAVGLAVAAVIELAYTLFTQGPDEALDPLTLSVSAAMMIDLSDDSLGQDDVNRLVMMGLLLAILFTLRIFLAERARAERPQLWWVPKMPDPGTQSPGGEEQPNESVKNSK